MTVENDARPIVGLTAYVTTGGRTESAHYAGALHFIEHLVFKGGTKRFAPTEFRKRIATLGDENGGWTWDDEIQFGFEVPVAAFDEALDIFAESLLELKFTEDWFESERKVVLQEIEKVSENPWHRVWDAFDQQMFSRHPYRRPVIGTESSIRSQTLAELEAYYRQRFTPNHLQLSLVGDFDTAEVVDTIRQRFAKYQPGPDSFELPPAEVTEPPLSQLTPKRHELQYGTGGVARLLAGFRTPGASHADTAGLLVLAELLDSASYGLGASLYRNEQWVSSLGVGHSYMVDHGQFTVRAELPVAKTGAVAAWLEAYLTSIAASSFTQDAVREAAQRVLLRRLRNWEQFGSQAQELGFMLERMGYDSMAQLTARILAQTPKSIARVAHQYFVPNAYVEVLQLPKGMARSPVQSIETVRSNSVTSIPAVEMLLSPPQSPNAGWDVSEQQSVNGVTWYRLENGFELIVKPSDANPTVTAVAHVAGGQWVEPKGKPGIGALTARTLTSGSKHLSVAEWDRILEAYGLESTTEIDLGDRSNVNRNVFMRDGTTYAVGGTRSQLPLVIGLVGEALFRPTFPEREVHKAKQGLLTEITTLQSDNLEFLKQEFYRHVFPGHPYGRPTIGTKRSISQLSVTDVREHHRRSFSPDRTTLAVVGPVAPRAVMRAVIESMADIAIAPLGPILTDVEPLPPTKTQQSVHLKRNQKCINFGRPSLPARHKDFEVLEVLMTVARGYHFYKYVYDLGVSYRSWVRLWPHRERSTWIMENDIAQAGFEKTLEEIRGDVRRYAAGFASKADVDVARRRLLNRNLLDGQRTVYSAVELARSNALGRGWQGPAHRLQRLRAVTTRQVQEMAKDIFGAKPVYEVVLQ